MRRRTALAALAALAALLLTIPETIVAQAPQIPFPKLPAGAGEMDKDAPKILAATPSGLQYRVLRKGAGEAPKATSTVKVNYHGWLDDGKVFDSSYARREPIEFPLNGVIPGWTEGMQLVAPGGMIELSIPGKLGYGDRGVPGTIPPGATLHFLVELLEVR
ncbi:MAG: FKBP-type peptidyl-prolyl cis-trans isomerase [Planctomycetaceae bacterium]